MTCGPARRTDTKPDIYQWPNIDAVTLRPLPVSNGERQTTLRDRLQQEYAESDRIIADHQGEQRQLLLKARRLVRHQLLVTFVRNAATVALVPALVALPATHRNATLIALAGAAWGANRLLHRQRQGDPDLALRYRYHTMQAGRPETIDTAELTRQEFNRLVPAPFRPLARIVGHGLNCIFRTPAAR